MSTRAEGHSEAPDAPPIIPSERVRAEVATWAPFTEDELDELAVLLRPVALELRRRRIAATAKPTRRKAVARSSGGGGV